MTNSSLAAFIILFDLLLVGALTIYTSSNAGDICTQPTCSGTTYQSATQGVLSFFFTGSWSTSCSSDFCLSAIGNDILHLVLLLVSPFALIIAVSNDLNNTAVPFAGWVFLAFQIFLLLYSITLLPTKGVS